HFIFRVELDPDPHSREPHRLTDFELATRLSYYLWSSTPDTELLELARGGLLHSPDVLREQVERMLADEKAQALIDNFAGQWLYTRGVIDAEPDPAIFPEFTPVIRDAMRQEADLFFREILEADHHVNKLVGADFTYLNGELAKHYAIERIEHDDFRRVQLQEEDQLGGLPSMGSLMTATSYPSRPSPGRRGHWVMKQLICNEPPAPSPGVAGLMEEVDNG